MSTVNSPTEVGSRATVLKMVVNTVARSAGQGGDIEGETITLSAVYSDKEGSPNKQWSKWTPCAQLSFTVSNPNVFGKILPGQFYMIDLTRCEKDAI